MRQPPLPYMDLYPPPSNLASPSLHCFHFINSFGELSSLETGNNDLLHPEECPSASVLLSPTPNNPGPPSPRVNPAFATPPSLNLNKMRIPQSLKNASPSVLRASKNTLNPFHSSFSFFNPLRLPFIAQRSQKILPHCSFSVCPLLVFEM